MNKIVIIISIILASNSLLSSESDGCYLYGFGKSFEKYQNDNYPFLISENPEWIDIQTGLRVTIALKNDGTLWGIGQNSYGQLGMGHNDSVFVLTQIGTDNDWQKISSLGVRCLAIKNNGTLWAWGENSKGGVGDGTQLNSNIPIKISDRNDWANVYALLHNSFAVTKDSILYGWGDNTDGQSFYEVQLFPTIIDSTRKIIDITNISEYITLLIDKDNDLWQMEYLGGVNVLDSINIYLLKNYKELPKILKIDGELNSYFAIDLDSNLWYFGKHYFGAFGNSNIKNVDVLTKHNLYKKVKGFSIGSNFSGVIDDKGNLYSSGLNIGQFDANIYKSVANVPVKLSNDNDWVKVSCKANDFLVLKKSKIDYESSVRIENKINIYPNPSKSKIVINSKALITEISLYSLNFSKIVSYKANHSTSQELDISKLITGVYFIKVNEDFMKFVKE